MSRFAQPPEQGEQAAADGEDRKFVVALARGLDLLRCFRPSETLLGNGELAARTGLAKSTVTRLTYTLAKSGYLHYDPRTNKYALDGGVLAIAHAFMAGYDVLQTARAPMRELAREIGAAVSIGCRQGWQMVYLDTVRSETALTLGLAPGSRLSMLTSSMGRAYLAVLPLLEREALLRELLAAEGGVPARADPVAPPQVSPALALQAARGAIEGFAQQGCCFSFGEWHPDINAVAVPFRDPARDRWLVLSCSGPVSSMAPPVFIDVIAPRLKALAQRLGPV